ncbi:EF-hand domain-containing protein [Streptomyces alanosinicus]|uniref:EF-hand domain-containing protein n=1 Tax=Streptomyces alanosinicus TaxID=68171 RepID=UPI001E301216|nr:EF-hand domain-containing protein [Streptomyces alanosinicus]
MNDTIAKRRVFAMLDADGDGIVSKHEYLARTKHVVAATRRAENDPLVIAAQVAGEQAWASMDSNGDGRMTFDEYAAWAGTEAFDSVCEPTLGALFDLADTDADGTLTRSEFTILREALGNPVGNAHAAFDALDTDGDGRISREQYLASIREHVTGEGSPMGEALYSDVTAAP